jgi:transposase InsO family protein
MRRKWPDWGAPVLAWTLEQEGVKMPWITVHRILKRHGLVSEEVVRPATQRFERAQPNELWQMDFKGMAASRPGCLPLSLLDDHSRYMVGLWALESTKGAGVRQALEQRFREVGMPQALLMDHGTPWWTPGSRIGLTVLTVWLLKLGIGVHFCGFRHPQTQGKVERWHGSLERAMRWRGFPSEFAEQQGWLESFRRQYANTTSNGRTRRAGCNHRHVSGGPASDPIRRRSGNGSIRRACAWSGSTSKGC